MRKTIPVFNSMGASRQQRRSVQRQRGTAGGKFFRLPRSIALLLAYVAFVIYGSLVPLAFQPLEWSVAVQRFQETPYLSLGVGHRADWVANILLFVPLGFLGLAVLAYRISIAKAAAAVVAVACFSFVFSMAIEFTQLWFPPRTVSQNDILAETIGGILGCLLWICVGPTLVDWLVKWSDRDNPATRLDRLLLAYCVGLAIYSVLPLDLTVSLAEIHVKYRSGRINLIPFANHRPWSLLHLYDLMRDVLVFLPVGALAYATFHGSTKATRFVGSLLLGLTAVAAIELAQLLVFSRYADVTDFFSCGLGVLLGVLVRRRSTRNVETEWRGTVAQRPCNQSPAYWLMIVFVIAYCLLLLGGAWRPFNFNIDPQFLRSRARAFTAAPLTSLYYGSEFGSLANALQRTMWFAPLGFMLDRVARRAGCNGQHRRAVLTSLVLCSAALGLFMELGQLAIPAKTPSLDGVLLSGLGALAGVFISRSVFRQSSPPATSTPPSCPTSTRS